MIEFDKELLINHINENPDNRQFIKNVFNNNDVIDCIELGKYDRLYDYLNSNYSGYGIGLITSVLLCSGIDFTEYLQDIPDYCFFKLPISKIIIPNNIEMVGYNAFSECAELTRITLPESITNIGKYAFDVTSQYPKLDYLGTVEEWEKVRYYSNSFGIIDKIKCIDDWVYL